MFKVGQKVNYATRSQSGIGKVVAIRETVKGNFYDVEDKETKMIKACRAAKMSAA